MYRTLYILGTSNSILRSGYVSYLQQHFDVKNLSIGGSPFHQFVFNILQIDKNEFYSNKGLIVIENIVNDDNLLGYCSPALLAKRALCAQQAILFAASRFPVMVVEFLNKRHFLKRHESFFSALYREVCLTYDVPFFSFPDSLKEIKQKISVDDCYMDEVHLKPELAVEITPYLIDFIKKIDRDRLILRSDLSLYKAAYSYLPMEDANEQVGTSLRLLPVNTLHAGQGLSFKGQYFLEAIVIDISKTNCILEIISGKTVYHQGLRYMDRSKAEFKIVALHPIDCSDTINLQILSQQLFHSNFRDQSGELLSSPHEDHIDLAQGVAQARIVGFITRTRLAN
jgi:hypothetical protein